MFKKLLLGPAIKADAFYILGDLFDDFWIGCDDIRSTNQEIIKILQKKSQAVWKSWLISSSKYETEKIIKNGLHGVFFLGSTSQSQLISITEKKELISKAAQNKFKNQFYFGVTL